MRAILVTGLAFFGIGMYELLTGPGMRHLSGLGFALFGGVLVASLALRYERPGLEDARWSASRPRRIAKFVLAYTWRVVAAVMIAGVVVAVVDKLT